MKLMENFSIADAVTLLSQQTSNVTTLWAFYTAAAFAAASFGGAGKMTIREALLVTLGFWTFTLGHLELLRLALIVQNSVGAAIAAATPAHGGEFKGALASLTSTNSSLWISTAAHLTVDVCATGAMWARVLGGEKTRRLARQ